MKESFKIRIILEHQKGKKKNKYIYHLNPEHTSTEISNLVIPSMTRQDVPTGNQLVSIEGVIKKAYHNGVRIR